MATNPTRPADSSVVPVVDYEPPARPVSERRHRQPVRQRRDRGHPPPARPALVPLPHVPRAAAGFADATLRRVLEVIDRRRPAAHLYPLLAAGLVDSLQSGRLGSGGRTEAATLQRLRLQPIGPQRPPAAIEVSASYRRGRRIHALACRIEQVPAAAGPGWQVVALHIG